MKDQRLSGTMKRGISSLEVWGRHLLSDMVAIPTVSPEGKNYEDFVGIVKERLDARGIRSRLHRVPDKLVRTKAPEEAEGNPRFILIARTGSGHPVFHINCHYDVVPGGPGWTVTEPFKPKLLNGKVYGRGSTDMKGGIASALMALASLTDDDDLPGTVEVALVPDEEVGAECGTIHLLDSGLVKPDFAVIAEPSGECNLLVGHKGVVWVEVTVPGRTAHGSTPWFGVNAFEKMVEVARSVERDLKPKVIARTSKYKYDTPGGERATMVLGGVTRVEGKINQVPGAAMFTIDRRVLPEEHLDQAESELETFLEGLGAQVRVVNRMPPCVTASKSELVKGLSEAAQAELGLRPSARICAGGLDMGFYVSRGFNCVTYGPGELGLAHAPDEFTRLQRVYAFSRIYARAAVRLLRGQ